MNDEGNGKLSLEEIPGLGPQRRAALEKVGVVDLQGLLDLKLEQLAAVRGIGAWQARRIQEFLKQRGFVLVSDETGAPAILGSAEDLARDGEVVQEAVAELQAIGDAERQAVEEVAEVAEALEEALIRQEEESSASVSALEDEQNGVLSQAADPETDPEESSDGAKGAAPDSTTEALQTQRETLPDSVLELIDAIRQAAVSPQLTRQMTRLLIVSGEFTSGRKEVSPKQQAKALANLQAIDSAIQTAVTRRRFGRRAQRDLAKRIRDRRQRLEKLLEKRN